MFNIFNRAQRVMASGQGGALKTEFLLPYHQKQIDLDEIGFIKAAKPAFVRNHAALETEIQRLGPWEYFVDFGGGVTTRLNASFNDRTVEFHRYRSKLITETACQLLGPNLESATILDLACHCGFFSLDIAHEGVHSVEGVDFREKNIAQAEFLKKQFGKTNVSFAQGDVYDLDPRPVDVVLCLGLMYHLVRPIDVLELCFKTATKFAVIESICHKEPISAYKVVGDKNVQVAIEGTRPVELQPTYRGLIDSMRQVGFDTIIEVVGHCDTNIELFSDGYRRCLIGIKDGYRDGLQRLPLEQL